MSVAALPLNGPHFHSSGRTSSLSRGSPGVSRGESPRGSPRGVRWGAPGGARVVGLGPPISPEHRSRQNAGGSHLSGEWLRSRAPRGSTGGTPRETPENSTPEAHLRAQRKQKPLKHLNFFWARSDGRTEIPNEDHVFVKTAPDSLTRGQFPRDHPSGDPQGILGGGFQELTSG